MNSPIRIALLLLLALGCSAPARADHDGATSSPPAAATAEERLSDLDRLRLKERYLEFDLARQRVQMIATAHAEAVRVAKVAEGRWMTVQGEFKAKLKLSPSDKIDLDTGAVTRGQAPGGSR